MPCIFFFICLFIHYLLATYLEPDTVLDSRDVNKNRWDLCSHGACVLALSGQTHLKQHPLSSSRSTAVPQNTQENALLTDDLESIPVLLQIWGSLIKRGKVLRSFAITKKKKKAWLTRSIPNFFSLKRDLREIRGGPPPCLPGEPHPPVGPRSASVWASYPQPGDGTCSHSFQGLGFLAPGVLLHWPRSRKERSVPFFPHTWCGYRDASCHSVLGAQGWSSRRGHERPRLWFEQQEGGREAWPDRKGHAITPELQVLAAPKSCLPREPGDCQTPLQMKTNISLVFLIHSCSAHQTSV